MKYNGLAVGDHPAAGVQLGRTLIVGLRTSQRVLHDGGIEAEERDLGGPAWASSPYIADDTLRTDGTYNALRTGGPYIADDTLRAGGAYNALRTGGTYIADDALRAGGTYIALRALGAIFRVIRP